MSESDSDIDDALCAAWFDHHEPGSPSPDGGPLVVTGPGQDGTAVLGPQRIIDDVLCFGALVPPGVALEPAGRTGFRLVVWHVDARRTVINLWREPWARKVCVTLREAQACLMLWASTPAEVRLMDDWLRGRAEHSRLARDDAWAWSDTRAR